MDDSIQFAQPLVVNDVNDCFFYHSFDDIEGVGSIDGEWDLRSGVESYTGHYSFAGKHVLEVGPASGFVTAFMESAGAKVVCMDLNKDVDFECVPFHDLKPSTQEELPPWEKLNNSFWYIHKKKNLKAKVLYKSVYEIPHNIGFFDVGVFGSILLHLRDPFLALKNASQHIRDTIIVTEPMWRLQLTQRLFFKGCEGLGNIIGFPIRPCFLLPNSKNHWPNNSTWWYIPPYSIREMLRILGFTSSIIYYHSQIFNKERAKSRPHYTIVASKTKNRMGETD